MKMNEEMWRLAIDGPEMVNIVRDALKNLYPTDPLWSLMEDSEFFGEDASSKVRCITVCDDGTATIEVKHADNAVS